MIYLVTLKRNCIGFTSIEQIKNKYISLFVGIVFTRCMCIELDSRKRLHLHAIIETEKTPHYKSFMSRGWHCFLRKIHEDTAHIVYKYVYKNYNPQYQNEMELISYANYHNMFT